ncbi:hypothetical protein [Actinoallomurus sp. CA-142502]|uniref:hypothetical protein n=1 Tax=Actinoallomurus sp. CA-142502 TaxID=3239885 RepID=UPI003D9102A6
MPPGLRPHDFHEWPASRRVTYDEYRRAEEWHLLFEGVVAGNGLGSHIQAERAAAIAEAFAVPWTFARVHTAEFYDDAGFCPACDVPYCFDHWNVSVSGYGRCPHGHGKSLDPHWSPD